MFADLAIAESPRFQRSYAQGGVKAQAFVEGAVHDFARGYAANPRTVSRDYQRVRGLPSSHVLEIDVAGSLRCLAEWSAPTLTLLTFGDKRVVPAYKRSWLERDLATATPARPWFYPSRNTNFRFFSRKPDLDVEIYGSELTPEWLYFLDSEQTAAYERIAEAHIDAEPDGRHVFFVIGGPGTGKTSILLQLLKAFTDLEVPVGISISDPVAHWIRTTLPIALDDYRTGLGPHRKRQVLLIDDPDSRRALRSAASNLASSSVRTLVVAFDPLQLDRALSDADFDATVEEAGAQVIELGTCYRQKRNVGEAFRKTAEAIAESTPYSVDYKVSDYRARHRKATDFANGLSFPNPHGYVDVHIGAIADLILPELERIARSPASASPWPSTLIVSDDKFKGMPTRKDDSLWMVELTEVESIKGLEFQHVLILLTESRFKMLENGFTGSGRRAYDEWRLVRIPFSRAKDSMVTLVQAGI